MTTADITVIATHPMTHRHRVLMKDTRLAASMDRTLLTLNAVEGLVVLSGGILDAVTEGESYEVLTRRLAILHENLLEVSQLAASARVEGLAAVALPAIPAVVSGRGRA